MAQPVNILAIESSCDETSVAIVTDGHLVQGHIIASQVRSHMRFGGVVPEVASRHHVEQITQIVEQVFAQAQMTWADITAIAVTEGPGLVGSLLIGITAAKALAFAHQLPLIPVNHMAGHIYANRIVSPLTFPLLALLVSGGHTELIYMPADNHYELLGETRDDAVGEAYDKVGRVLNLPYPGGKAIDELAHLGQDNLAFPRAMLHEPHYDFSFSGLKSAVINTVHRAKQRGETIAPEDLAASFQASVIDVLVAKTTRALAEFPVKQFLVAGGVAANRGLRHALQELLTTQYPDVAFRMPPLSLCGDNAAMIGAAAYANYQAGQFANMALNASPGLSLAND